MEAKTLDGPSLKALAHPLRMRLLAELRYHGPNTATGLGEALGESSGATSYHLRVLAAHGFVVDDTAAHGGRGRERWWRSAQDMTTWASGEVGDDPEERAADDWLAGYLGRGAARRIDEWLARRGSVEPEWLAAGDQSDYRIVMTPEQSRAMMAEVHAVALRYWETAGEALAAASAEERERARPVEFLFYALPLDRDA